ncbi:hypothetical protein MMC11_000667 [Xylographa trunciseda]|nr:hypothetical protein [Xylographa trunciseda]
MANSIDIGLRIPEELIWTVIQQTEDVETMQNWCIAITYHKDLYPRALQKRWGSITIGRDDLVAPPYMVQLSTIGKRGTLYRHQEIANYRQRVSCENQLNGTGLIEAATKEQLLGRAMPATYIKKLVLNFRFDHDVEKPLYRHGSGSEGLPGDILEYSLVRLFPHLTKAESITVDCRVPQELLKAIATLTGGRLKSLTFRISSTMACFRSPGRKGLCSQYLLKWEKLEKLKSLEVLEIRELASKEGYEIALAVRELHSLKRVLLKTDRQPGSPDRLFVYLTDPSPLQKFFDSIFPTSDGAEVLSKTCGLPKTLESLVLLDSFHLGSRRAKIGSPPSHYRSSYPFLSEIVIDLADHDSCFNLMKWLSDTVLSTIKIPCHILNIHRPFEPVPTVAALQTEQFINTVVYHPLSLLSELVLLDAWTIEPGLCDHLNKRLENCFSIEELILGTEEPWNYRFNALLRSNMFRDPKEGGSRKWGSKIKRLRIEHFNLSEVKFDWLSAPEWAHLRVLILDSWQTSPLTSSQMQYPTMSALPESAIATAFALKAIPNLRVVVVGAFQFWIHRASTPVVMYLSEAQKHPAFRADVKSWLTARDRSFLKGDSPYIPPKCRSTEIPLQDTLGLSNYLVLRRVDGA